MAELEEDMILEIVVRLPLKYAIRCMVLNKNLFRLISQQKKSLVSSAYPDIEGSIFSRYDAVAFKRMTRGSSKISMRTIPKRYDENPIILDSCNGVLLLYFYEQSQSCVFNPITGGIMLVNPFIKHKLRDVRAALAVDLDAKTIFQFKLVVAETFSHSEDENLWRFTVLVPSGGTSWLIKSPVELICRGDLCMRDQFVYVLGCVYWADERNHSIIMFDVEKEKARRILWPQYPGEAQAFFSGSSDGSLQCVYTLHDVIEIHSYDQVKDAWQLKHKIMNTVIAPGLLLCDGQCLLNANCNVFWLFNHHDKVLFMYDILSDKWEKIGIEGLSFYNYVRDNYFSFVPTLAKVSDKYLHDPEFEFAEVYLRGLQRLVMQETGDVEVIG
ncbi:hypothetical protein ACS0TY_035372 [Phlomoides rotata]